MKQVKYLDTRKNEKELKSLLMEVYGKYEGIVDKHLNSPFSFVVGSFDNGTLIGAFGGRLISDNTMYLDINLVKEKFRLTKTFYALCYGFFMGLDKLATNYKDIVFTGVLDDKKLEKRLISKNFFHKKGGFLFFSYKDIKGVINVLKRNKR